MEEKAPRGRESVPGTRNCIQLELGKSSAYSRSECGFFIYLTKEDY